MKVTSTVRSILCFLLIVFVFFPGLALAEEPKPRTLDAAEFKAGEIIAKFKKGVPQTSVQSLLLAEDVSILDEMGDFGLVLLSVPRGQELEEIEKLKHNPLVEYAEPNYVVQVGNAIAAEPDHNLRVPDIIPNDPYLPNQWSLPQIGAPAAWDVTTGSDKVVVAVIDSGVDLEHSELKGKVWTNQGEIPGNGIDDDGNNFVDDVHGWDFVNWDGEPQDDYGHGTFVAGIAASATNNGVLMAGVSWGAEIMPVKVLDQGGGGYIYEINGGIIYAADNGAKIINLSWSFHNSDYPHSMQNVVNYAHSEGALVVAGSGDPASDDSVPLDEYQYPAALNHVVSIAATDRYDERWSDSTYNDQVDVAAPGKGILSLLPGGYGYWDSTGLAAAHVSGLAALIWSVNPTLTPDEVESIIESTAVDLGEPGRDDYFGHGRIDASAAVIATPHYLQVEPDGLDFLLYGDNSPVRTITNPGTNSSTWTATASAPWLSISPPEAYTPSSATASIDISSLSDYGVYTATITAASTLTNCLNCSQPITVTAVYTRDWKIYLPLLFSVHAPASSRQDYSK